MLDTEGTQLLIQMKTQYLFLIGLLQLFLLETTTLGFVQHPPITPFHSQHTSRFLSFQDNQDPSIEVLESLVEFHNGQWKGTSFSFAVTADVAAGVIQKKTQEYNCSVQLGLSQRDDDDDNTRELTLTETLGWEDNKISSRRIPLLDSNLDVDSVDASYSLDMALPNNLPFCITGTDKLLQFGIEHCLAVSNHERLRCFCLYGVDQSLARVVVCDETKVKDDDDDKAETSSATDSSTAALDDPASRLAKAMKASEEENKLERHVINLLELTSGVWLGDAIIRDLPQVKASPFDKGTGFGPGRTAAATSKQSSSGPKLAQWELGVQKSAWRWLWDFGESIRQQDDLGKAMGAEMAPELSTSLSGQVCLNEGLSRRIPKAERMVYIDWDNGNHVGFIVGSVSIQVPRFVTFERSATKKTKPFFTEFCVYQSTLEDAGNLESSLETVCSKIARVYNFEGKLKQGCTSFYTLKSFDTMKE